MVAKRPSALRRATWAVGWAIASALATPTMAEAQVWGGTDASGSVVLTNHPGGDALELIVAAPNEAATRGETVVAAFGTPRGTASRWRDPPPSVAGAIRRAAARHDLPETLLTALIAVESGFDHRAVSPKGAQGLMQLMPRTARRFGVRDAFAVEDNLDGGAMYLRWLLTHFDQDVELALAAYNAGEGAVERAGRRVPPYPETQDYVRKVMALSSTRGTSTLRASPR